MTYGANNNTLNRITITAVNEVIDSINCLKTGKALGPDEIFHTVLKQITKLSLILCHLFYTVAAET